MKQLRVALLFIIVICMCSASMGFNFTCKQAERKALLVFKHSFTVDAFNLLGSWVGQDCCNWEGVGCDNVTGNVIKLDLGGERYTYETGEVNPALLELKFLRYLDLSFIGFNGSRFPEFIGTMSQLQYLNLSFTSFSGKVPRLLGNLTELVFLDLRGACLYCEIERNDLEWAFKLEKLKYLDLTEIDLRQALDSLNLLHKLPSLSVLNLVECGLGNSHQHIRNSNISSSILQHLDLQDNHFSGPIPHFIQNLSSLKYLDLSSNHLNSPIPSWLGNRVDLKYLSLGSNYFNGSFPHSIQRFSFLTSLDLSNNQFSFSVPSWLANNRYLEFLSLGRNNFNRVDGGIMSIIGRLCRLKNLDLSHNQLQEHVPESHVNFSRCSIYDLEQLDLLSNNLEALPASLGKLSSLYYLDLSYNNLRVVSPVIGNLSSLNSLYLSNNNLEALPPSLWKLSSLYSLDLSYNNLSVVSPVIGNLSSLNSLYLSNNNLKALPPALGKLPSLHSLRLSYNNLSVVSTVIGSLSSLRELDLSHNNLEALPPSLGKLSSLHSLFLSYNNLSVVSPIIASLSSLGVLDLSHNKLEALPPSLGDLSSLSNLDLSYNNLSVVHQVSLANLSSLNILDISSNSLILDLSPDWMPPFQLDSLSILPCKLNSSFPKWVLSQRNILELDLSDTGIFGALPHNIGNAMPHLQSLRLASNHINGSIPRSLCGLADLVNLDLQKNRLSGMIPDCWVNSQIIGVELCSNRLSGHIPNSLTEVSTLLLLSLSNNSLEGELPLQLSNSATLTILDLGRNNLHGEIPRWNGANFPFLQIFILRENRFNGTIPQQLCSFHALQIIDLARNNLVGTIPECFVNFRGMGFMQHLSHPYASFITANEWSAVEVIKGAEREYTSVLHLLVNMDLSCNFLVGVIPAQISNLCYLVGLNLSHNHLKGTIPKEIGKMTSLESLDLSFNNLSGSIPEGISLLDSLSTMNLSFNNLQGQIPTGRHLQTLNDSSIYMGNPGLCGNLLPKKCFPEGIAHPPTSMVVEDEEDNKHEKMWLYLVIMLGFATGFWGVIGTLVVNKNWRYAYFGIAEELADRIYVRVAVRIARANRRG